jgi:hypothetical protein
MITPTHPGRSGVLKQRISTLVWFAALVILCVVAVTPHHLHAQTSKGILAGVIRDSTGAVLPNASLLITNEDTHETRTVTSSSIGAYRVEAINPGNYSIHITGTGFSPSTFNTLACFPPSLLPTTPR